MPKVVASLGFSYASSSRRAHDRDGDDEEGGGDSDDGGRPSSTHARHRISSTLESSIRMLKRDIAKAKHAPSVDKVKIAHLQTQIGDVCLEYGEAALALDRGFLPALKTVQLFLVNSGAFTHLAAGKRIWQRGVKACLGAANAYAALGAYGTARDIGRYATQIFGADRLVQTALSDLQRSEHIVFLSATIAAYRGYAVLLHEIATHAALPDHVGIPSSPTHLREALKAAQTALQYEDLCHNTTQDETTESSRGEEDASMRWSLVMAAWNPLTDLARHDEALKFLESSLNPLHLPQRGTLSFLYENNIGFSLKKEKKKSGRVISRAKR